MHTALSKGRRAQTARGVTLLSLLASTVSFASAFYVGPETAKESLGIEHAIEVVLPDPQAAFAGNMPSAYPIRHPASGAESVASMVRIGGMAVGMRTDEAIDASRMAPLAASLRSQAVDALQGVHHVIGPAFRYCAQAVLDVSTQDAGYVLHPMSAFLSSGPDLDRLVRDWLRRDADAEKRGAGQAACVLQDRTARRGLAMRGPLQPEAMQHRARKG